ncbi:MAG TPA: S8 family peptidase [Longimicrobium sp.]
MNTLRIATIAAAAALLAACSDKPSGTLTAPPAASDQEMANLLENPGNPDRIQGRYVVVLKDGNSASTTASRHAIRTRHEYTAALQGFAADLTAAQVAQLRRDPSVKYVAEDLMAYPSQEDVSPTTVQTPATWGIDRLDQPRLPLNSIYRYTTTGPANVYVIDTGVRPTHTQFDGLALNRAHIAADFTGGNGLDCNGHGTHVAGTIAGTTYGVAKAARVHSVRVFGCTGGAPFSTIIAAMDWVANMHVKPAVLNMSLGGSFFAPVNDAVTNLVMYGVTTVVAAGNSAANACNYSPASAPLAITVANSRITDARSASSNYGTCTDLYAPGESITSAWYTSDVATAVLTGTSMASPHVAGLAALFLQRSPTATPAMVSKVLIDDATPGIVTGFISGQNRLATRWNGTLTVTGSAVLQPTSHQCSTCHYFTTAVGGYLHAWLAGPSGTNFNLQLYRLIGSSWVLVATQATSSTNEYMVYYNASPGQYRYRVSSALGGGTFDLFVRKS